MIHFTQTYAGFFTLIVSFLISHLGFAKPDENQLNRAYQYSLLDAARITPEEISYQLNAIHPNNNSLIWNEDKTKLLVVTWKSKNSYESYLKPETATSTSEEHVVWVTLAPQVQQFCRNLYKNYPKNGDKVTLRLKQYLGLNHTWNYDVFVELWVSPDDLFRPCVDPDTQDSQCNLEFSSDIPEVRNINNYKTFYQNLYYSSFRQRGGAPWTGLGYTYNWDWHGLSEVGASEYILVPGAHYEIKDAVPTLTYCDMTKDTMR
ncbi:MAG: hypothetical protein AAF669_00365 [Pseudomonadota bacterium]